MRIASAIEGRRLQTNQPLAISVVLLLVVLASLVVAAPSVAASPARAAKAGYGCDSHWRLVSQFGGYACRRGHSTQAPMCSAGRKRKRVGSGAFVNRKPAWLCKRRSGGGSPVPGPVQPTPPSGPTPTSPVPPVPPVPKPGPVVPEPSPNPAASTTQYWSEGSYGANSVGTAACIYKDIWGSFNLTVGPPVVRAHDYSPGAGNDSQWVRWKTYLITEPANTTYAEPTWSEWQKATDVTPAAFQGERGFTGAPANAHLNLSYLLDLRIEWWDAAHQLGATAHRVSDYSYWFGERGPFLHQTSCWLAYRVPGL